MNRKLIHSAEDLDERAIARAAYRWNTIAGLVVAFQSVIILMVVTRICDVVTAGIFTLAYANGNLFLNMGKYGMRQFQASDRRGQFTFREYRASRIGTTIAMIVCCMAYLCFLALSNGYTPEKTAIVAILGLYEAVSAFEDVYHGNFQQHDRLDVGARFLALRVISTIALLCACVIITKSLLVAVTVATVYTALFLVGEIVLIPRFYDLPVLDGGFAMPHVGKLLKTCFPLFAAAFLLFYIGNAPRYAIDALMSDTAQAYYGYIAMPVFIVVLLASFIYNPMIASLTDQWHERKVQVFLKRFAGLVGIIFGITIVSDLLAFFLGVPVLDLLYNADTQPYLFELLILVTGGGFLAISSLMVLGITIIRFQRVLIPVYAVMAVVAWYASSITVGAWGITGAAWTYLGCMILLSVSFVALFLVGVKMLSKS